MLNAATILDEVAKYRGIARSDIKSRNLNTNVVMARHEALAATRELTTLSLAQIARVFDGRDHTCVVNSVARVKELRASKPEFREANDLLMDHLRSLLGDNQRAPKSTSGPTDIAKLALRDPHSVGASDIQALGATLLIAASLIADEMLMDDEVRLSISAILRGPREMEARHG
ncbi:MAG: hypothetical protein JXR35_03900 [Rhodobacteraceae bacterium]|nr:hypothetical protein [Paracoccaceae bacterium]